GQIRARKLLGSFRGMPPVRVDLLARTLHLLSLIPLAHPEVSEIDINPIIIEDDAPVVVDALVILASQGE
ncbi:MAG: acetate--CoA ligase family protein, partial [Spirochaetes bacterium]|nr:acetate--CoA ligase family protein [Spirochaetota bacterium]